MHIFITIVRRKKNLVNRLLTSRKYKIKLVLPEFNSIEKGIGKLIRIVDSQMGKDAEWIREIQERLSTYLPFINTN